MKTIQSKPYTLPYFPYQILTLQASITPGPDTRQLGWAPIPKSPLKSFKLANLKPAYSACFFLSMEITIKALSSGFLPFLCLMIDPVAFLCGPIWHSMFSPLGNYEIQTIFSMVVFSWSVDHIIPGLLGGSSELIFQKHIDQCLTHSAMWALTTIDGSDGYKALYNVLHIVSSK